MHKKMASTKSRGGGGGGGGGSRKRGIVWKRFQNRADWIISLISLIFLYPVF